tara:strand:- start:187 stop:303 length:117 start_codon:yes stop_codon:yes gene_type:complete
VNIIFVGVAWLNIKGGITEENYRLVGKRHEAIVEMDIS